MSIAPKLTIEVTDEDRFDFFTSFNVNVIDTVYNVKQRIAREIQKYWHLQLSPLDIESNIRVFATNLPFSVFAPGAGGRKYKEFTHDMNEHTLQELINEGSGFSVHLHTMYIIITYSQSILPIIDEADSHLVTSIQSRENNYTVFVTFTEPQYKTQFYVSKADDVRIQDIIDMAMKLILLRFGYLLHAIDIRTHDISLNPGALVSDLLSIPDYKRDYDLVMTGIYGFEYTIYTESIGG
jgi:hypothetical protein